MRIELKNNAAQEICLCLPFNHNDFSDDVLVGKNFNFVDKYVVEILI